MNIKKILTIKYNHQLEELDKLDENNISLISSIYLIQINFDINYLCGKNLSNLKELSLIDNNIEDISPLANASFNKLEKLDLSRNKLNNNNICIIKKFKFDNLNYIDLYCNNFSDYELFKALEIFKKLENLSVGSNRFNIISFDINKTKINLNSIKRISFMNGVFSEATIKVITCLLLDNLNELYLDGNDLNSLEFMKEVKWPLLEKIILNNNNISDIKPLNKFKKLKVVEIKNNNIICSEDFKEIINNMKTLEEIYISGNKINANNKDYNNK